jgi:hypothetical protein
VADSVALHAAQRTLAGEAFWDALGVLDVERAGRRAPDDEHRQFVAAFREMLDGRMPEAARDLRRLYVGARDSLLRRVARATLASALAYQQDWRALFDLAHDPVGVDPDAAARDRASILAWSEAMRHVPAPEYPRLGGPVVLPSDPTAPHGVPVIQVRINGRTRALWLDTGSSTTLIASDVAAASQVSALVADTLEIVTSIGRVRAQPAVISRLDIGALKVTGLHAAIVDEADLRLKGAVAGAPIRSDDTQVSGVLGFDLLQHYDVEIDYAARRVTLRQPRRLGGLEGGRRNLFWLGYPVVRVRDRDGTQLHFGLDTGAEQTFAAPSLMAKRLAAARKSERGRGRRRSRRTD